VQAREACVLVAAVAAFALASAPPQRAAAEACSVRIGQRIALAAMSADPDVFIFDSRARLIDYAAGRFDEVKAVMAHTLLALPGTRAIVASCAPSAVKPKYSGNYFDAVGIKVTTGPYRGRWGWVSSEDLRV